MYGNGKDTLVSLTGIQLLYPFLVQTLKWIPSLSLCLLCTASCVVASPSTVISYVPPFTPRHDETTHWNDPHVMYYLGNSDKYAAAKDQVVRLLTESTTNRLL